ncbi:MAG: hypothetical protein K2Q24_08600 [Chitinophagaceae bacterium]|jgi:hypothetical protein|nr:hypothetical protein [Chitinophagaceae bacterium]
MLSSITWGQYLSAVLISLICYYTYVGYKYFHWELLAMIGIKKVESGATPIAVADLKKQFVSENHSDYLPKETIDTDLTPVINAFEDEVKAFLQEAGSGTDKASLLSALQQICQKYPVLRNSDNSDELNLFILKEVEKYNSEIIKVQDIQQLWR